MFEKQQSLFIYSVSPVHMGAGTAVGTIVDNPIQREVYTDYPMLAGSGIKGAARQFFRGQLTDAERKEGHNLVNRIFGPDRDGSEYAGAVSIADALLVAFPVRCLKHAFAYVTCPMSLARTARLLSLARINTQADDGNDLNWTFNINGSDCLAATDEIAVDGKVYLEAFEFNVSDSQNPSLKGIAGWLADKALPADPGFEYFRKKFKNHLVLVSDEQFAYFVRYSTVVEPHVRINDASGTAESGGLFYSENLPPECLLLSAILTSGERSGKTASPLSAEQVMKAITEGGGPNDQEQLSGLEGSLIEIGGDVTTGRGQVMLKTLGQTALRDKNHGNA